MSRRGLGLQCWAGMGGCRQGRQGPLLYPSSGTGAAGHVVEHNRNVDRVGDLCEVAEQTRLQGRGECGGAVRRRCGCVTVRQCGGAAAVR